MAEKTPAQAVSEQLADPSESLYRLISFTARDLRRAIRERLKEWNLSGTQFGVLLGAADGANVGEIAEQLLSDATSVGRVIERMENAGLVERFRQSPDRRVVWVRLQPEGVALLEKVLPHHVACTREMLGGLSPDDRDLLASLLENIRNQVADVPSSDTPDE